MARDAPAVQSAIPCPRPTAVVPQPNALLLTISAHEVDFFGRMRADRGPGRQEIHIFYRHTHTGTADGTAAPSMADEDAADGVRTAPTSPVMGAPAASAAPPGRLPRIVVMPSPPPGEVAAFGVSASAASAAGAAAAGDDAGLLAAQQRELADREEARHAAELFRLLPARCVGTGLHPPRPANVPAHVGPNHLPMSAHARWRRHQFPLRPAPAPAPACRVCASCLRRSPKAARRCGPRSRPMVDGWLMDSTRPGPAGPVAAVVVVALLLLLLFTPPQSLDSAGSRPIYCLGRDHAICILATQRQQPSRVCFLMFGRAC